MQTISFGWPLSEVISQHHERMDGSGYPRAARGRNSVYDPTVVDACMRLFREQGFRFD